MGVNKMVNDRRGWWPDGTLEFIAAAKKWELELTHRDQMIDATWPAPPKPRYQIPVTGGTVTFDLSTRPYMTATLETGADWLKWVGRTAAEEFISDPVATLWLTEPKRQFVAYGLVREIRSDGTVSLASDDILLDSQIMLQSTDRLGSWLGATPLSVRSIFERLNRRAGYSAINFRGSHVPWSDPTDPGWGVWEKICALPVREGDSLATIVATISDILDMPTVSNQRGMNAALDSNSIGGMITGQHLELTTGAPFSFPCLDDLAVDATWTFSLDQDYANSVTVEWANGARTTEVGGDFGVPHTIKPATVSRSRPPVGYEADGSTAYTILARANERVFEETAVIPTVLPLLPGAGVVPATDAFKRGEIKAVTHNLTTGFTTVQTRSNWLYQ